MGVDIDAILAYGIDFGEYDPLGEIVEANPDVFGDEPQFDEWYVWKYHNLAPLRSKDFGYDPKEFEDLPYRMRREAEEKYFDKSGYSEALDEYFSKKREISVPLSLVFHCCDSTPMYFLTLDGKEYSASWGYPKVIEPSELTVKDSEKELIVRVANDLCEYSEYEDGFEESDLNWQIFSRKW